MFEILKIANAIIRRVSSWLGCTKCCDHVPSEEIVVPKETCNKNDTENDEEHVNMHELPKFLISLWQLDENTQNSITLLRNSCEQLKVQEVNNNNNNNNNINHIKHPIKPPRKKLETNKCISTHLLSSDTSRTNRSNNRLMNDYLSEITKRQITSSFEKVEVSKIMTTEECNDYLLSNSNSQNISMFLTSSTKSPPQRSQRISSYISSYTNIPAPSTQMLNTYRGLNINTKKNMSTSTKIDSQSDLRKSSIISKLGNVLLLFRKTPKKQRKKQK